jgi:hypothetical protein
MSQVGAILTSLHGNEAGLDKDGRLVVPAGIQGVGVMPSFLYGDGSTDDTSALQRAIDKAEAMSPMGTVVLPEGTFAHTGLTVSAGIRIIGASDLRTRLYLKSGSNTSSLTYTGEKTGAGYELKQPRLENLLIDGNKAGQSGTSHGVYLPAISYSVGTDYAFGVGMFQVNIINCETNGINIGNNRNAGGFVRGSVRDSGGTGIVIGSASDWHFYHFGCGGNGGHGIYNVGGQIIRIYDCDIYSNTLAGIRMDSTANSMQVAMGSIDRNGQQGVLLNGAGTTVPGLVTILGTQFYENSAETTNTFADITLFDFVGGCAIGTTHKRSTTNSPKYLVNSTGTSSGFGFISPLYDLGSPPWGTAMTNDVTKLREGLQTTGWTTGGDAAVNGYVTVTINGTAYKMATIA